AAGKSTTATREPAAAGSAGAARSAIGDGGAQPAVAARGDLSAEDGRKQRKADAPEEERAPEQEKQEVGQVEPTALPTVALGAGFEFGAIGGKHRFDIVDGPRHPARKVALAEGGYHRVLDDQLRMQIRQRSFQAVTDLDAHLAVVERDEQQ